MCQARKSGLRATVESCAQCTLIAFGPEGFPRARTVTRLNCLEEGYLDFPTGESTRKVREIRANPAVTLFFVNPGTRDHASIFGTGEILTDSALKSRYWRDEFCQHWPGGPADPEYVVLRVKPRKGEYLVASSGEVGSVDFLEGA